MKALEQNDRALALLVALAGIAVFANSIFSGFALDDVFIIEGNPHVHSPSSPADIWLTPYWPFVGAELGLYRPGIIFLYAVQWLAGGGAPWVFHAVNIALHALAAVLVFILLRRLAGAIPAFVGALIFAVHPVHTEAVANVVGQAELVAAVIVLAACVIHSGRSDGVAVPWWRRITIAALFAFALTAKESAVVLPALLVITDLAQRRIRLTMRGFASYADAMLMPLFLLAATLALYLIVRYEVMGGAIIGVDAAPSMPFLREEYRVLNALRAFPEFLRLLFFPLDLAADYSPAAILPVDSVRPMVILGASLLLGLTVLTLLTPWLPSAGFPAAWFLISIITVSNLFFPIGVVIAERTLYLPSVAVAALVAFAWRALHPHMSRSGRRIATLIMTIVVVAFGVRTWIRNPVWDSTDTVWNSMMRDQPRSYRTQWLYAIKLWRANRLDEAEARFELAWRIYKRDSQLLTEYANFRMARGQFDEALPLLQQAQQMNPGIGRNTTTLMHAYLAVGRYDDAIRTAEFSRRMGGNPATTLPVRAFAKQQLGRFDDAVAAWRVAIDHSTPAAWRLHGFLARARGLAGLDSTAVAGIDSARAILPDSDSTALDSVQRAVRDGCYRRAAVSRVIPAPPDDPVGGECDDLGHWFGFIVDAQNAEVSQNAIQSIPIQPSAESRQSP